MLLATKEQRLFFIECADRWIQKHREYNKFRYETKMIVAEFIANQSDITLRKDYGTDSDERVD